MNDAPTIRNDSRRRPPSRRRQGTHAAITLVACGAIATAAAGGSGTSAAPSTAPPPTVLAVTVGEQGSKTMFTVPQSVVGGPVSVRLTNTGRHPHGAQLALVRDDHTLAEALAALARGERTNKLPDWLRARGGVASAAPGQTATAVVNLEGGHYFLRDPIDERPNTPAVEFTVTPGRDGPLPRTRTTITAASTGHDRYRWHVSGRLHAGANRITLQSKGGPDALHFAGLVRLNGNPSLAQIRQAFESNGKPPPFLDFSKFVKSTTIDGAGSSEVLTLNILKPGRYALFCPLSDRDGGKPHYAEGMLTKIKVH